MGDAAVFCSNCGYSPASASAAGGDGKDFGSQVKASSLDAFAAFKQLAISPVGGLSAAYQSLGPERALSAGIAMCVAFGLASSAGMTMGANQLQSLAFNWLGPVAGLIEDRDGIAAFLKAAVQFLVLPAAIAVVGLGLRKVVGAKPPISADIFTAGAAVAPLGAAMLLGGLIGVGNAEIALLLFFFALSYLFLMLFAGFTRLGEMSERAGAPAVPAAILLSLWLCKIVFAAFI
jgi:hypothetical protein